MRNPRLRDLTLEELEDLEQELLENGERSDYGYYAQLVKVYEEMHRRQKLLARKNSNLYGYSLQYTQKLLVSYLIKFGTYLKMNYFKDDRLAVESLLKAVSIEENLPIAYYRLGFLAYKHEEYSSAVRYFQQAIDRQHLKAESKYMLNQQQEFHAHMYLANSALYVAKAAYEEMEKLPFSFPGELPNLALSPLFATLSKNEHYLREHAFYYISKTGIKTCSKETCEELFENGDKEVLVVYFNDRENILSFNGEEAIVTPGQANMIRHFLLSSKRDKPCTRLTMRDFFGKTGSDGEVKKNTFIKSIERLRGRLKTLDMPDIIDVTQYRGETAYYFNESVGYAVLFRVDDAFANDYVS